MPSVFWIKRQGVEAEVISQEGKGGGLVRIERGHPYPKVKMVVPDLRDGCRMIVLWSRALRRDGVYRCRDDYQGRPVRIGGATALVVPNSPRRKAAKEPLRWGSKTFKRFRALREHVTEQFEERLARFA